MRLLLVALWAVAATACSAIGAQETLTDAQQVIADMKIGASEPKGADLGIVGVVDHADRRYRVGEPIILSVQVNKAADVAVLRVMPNGETTLIFPNRRQPSARVSAGTPLRIPPEAGAPLAITADRPGIVLFEFIASMRGDSWLFNRKLQASADFIELGTTTRALAKDIVLSLKVGHGSDTAASHLVIRVRGD
jgi:hypothetical protein